MPGPAVPTFSRASTDGTPYTLPTQRGASRILCFFNEQILFPFERRSLERKKVRRHAQEELNFAKAL